MKILWILNHYAQTPNEVGSTRHYGIAQHLRRHGWRTTIIAASVEHETGLQRLADGETSRFQNVDGVGFLWLRTPKYRGNGGGRLLNMLAYTWRVLFSAVVLDLPKPDVIIGSSVHPLAALSGAVLARRLRVPFVFEVRDLWPQTLIDLGRLKPDGLMTRALQWLELCLYRQARRIVVLLPKAGDYIEPLGIASTKIVWLPNGIELEGYPEPEPAPERKSFTLMYFGAHGQANGLDNLIRAMSLLSNRSGAARIHLRLIGNGPLKPQLVTLAADLGVKNVSFENPIAKKKIPKLAAEADAFVICVLDKPNLYRFGISMNKIFDYLAAGRPIVASCCAANNPVAESAAGITVPPGDPAALADAILDMANLPHQTRAQMGQAGRAFVERYHSYHQLASELADVLDSLVDRAVRADPPSRNRV